MQTIIVDMTPGFRMPTIYYSQGDVGTQFAIDLRSRFGDSFPTGTTVTIQATKPSGFGFSVAATSVTNGVATFTTTAEMTDEFGRFPAELKVTKTGLTLFTANFYMDGERNTHPEGTTDGSQETVIPELTQLVERVEDAASSVLDMTVVANTLPAGSDATYSYDEETNTATFGIPKGADGSLASGVLAPTYSSSSTYAVGDYVYYSGSLYRCTTAITTAEAWTSGHWTQVALAPEVSDLKSALNEEITYLRDENYDNRTASNSDFVDGMWGASLRTDGAYGLLRSMGFMIPLQNIDGKIFGTLPSNVVMAVACYDTDGTFINWSKLSEPITTNTFSFAGDYLKGNLSGVVYIRLVFSILSGGNYSRLNNAINIFSQGSKNIASEVSGLSATNEGNIKNVSSEQVLLFSELELFAKSKYIQEDGTLDNAGVHAVVRFKVSKGNFALKFNIPKNAGVAFGVVKDSNNDVVAVLTKAYAPYFGEVCRIVNLPDAEYTVYLNWFSIYGDDDYYDSAILCPYEPIETKSKYSNMARKPFAFNGKTALFVGDSITRGYTSSSTSIDSIYPTIFCNKVGMTFTNVAVAGSGYTMSDPTYNLMTQLQSAVKNTDFVFIAGGTNDILNLADMATFKSAVQDVVDYVLDNFTGEIIFITPIQTSRHLINNYGFEVSVGEYCDAITEIVSENNISMRMSVVQGCDFGFPDFDGDSTMKATMFGDDVHPSELGYKSLYVSGLLNALC